MSNLLLKEYGLLPMIGFEDLDKFAVDSTIYKEVLENRFCSCPDFADEEVAYSDKFKPEIRLMHRRMLESQGAGSWPEGCTFPGIHAVAYSVDWKSFPSHYMRPVTSEELSELMMFDVSQFAGRPMLKVALELVEIAYARVNLKLFYREKDDQIHILSKNIPGSTIGFAYFPNGTCGDHVTCTIDSSYKPGLSACATLLAHEIGHNNLLSHKFNNQKYHKSIMSYTPWRIFGGFSDGKGSRPLDASMAQLIKQYGIGDLTTPIEIVYPAVSGEMYVDEFEPGQYAIRGKQTIGKYTYIVVPTNQGRYRLTPDRI